MTWYHMSKYFSGSVKYCKNDTLKLSQAQKEHWLWKEYFPEGFRIISGIAAIEFKEIIKYMGERERARVCVYLLRQIILWYLIFSRLL